MHLGGLVIGHKTAQTGHDHTIVIIQEFDDMLRYLLHFSRCLHAKIAYQQVVNIERNPPNV